MPMIDLTLPAGALQRSALTTLVEDLTSTALHWERVADNPATRAMGEAMRTEASAAGADYRSAGHRGEQVHLPRGKRRQHAEQEAGEQRQSECEA